MKAKLLKFDKHPTILFQGLEYIDLEGLKNCKLENIFKKNKKYL